MEDRGLLLHLCQRQDAADAKQYLLTHAEFGFTLIQRVGQQAIALAVLGDIGVEQVKRDATNLQFPNFGAHQVGTNRNVHMGARINDWPTVKVVVWVQYAGTAIAAEFLQVIALSIEKPNAHERDAQVRCALQVVARQDSKSTGVLLHAFVNGKLA